MWTLIEPDMKEWNLEAGIIYEVGLLSWTWYSSPIPTSRSRSPMHININQGWPTKRCVCTFVHHFSLHAHVYYQYRALPASRVLGIATCASVCPNHKWNSYKRSRGNTRARYVYMYTCGGVTCKLVDEWHCISSSWTLGYMVAYRLHICTVHVLPLSCAQFLK